jgi:beta-1,4-glucosyltransferase
MTNHHSEEEKPLTHLEIAGISILDTQTDRLLNVLSDRQQASMKSILFFANSNFIVNCRHLFNQNASTTTSNVLVANDGIALDIAARIIHGKAFSANLNGTDFSPYFLKHYPGKLKIFLLGAKPEVVKKTKEVLSLKFPDHEVVGVQDGYFDRNQSDALINTINASGANMLFVAMGNPIQEQWILQYQHALNTTFIFAVGALFDFWSGNKIRAPKLVQALKLEWLFRLCQEPKRLFKRYTLDMFRFLYISIRYTKKS